MFFIPSNLLKNDWKRSDDKDINAIFICSFWNIDFLKLDTAQFQTFCAYQINPLGLTFFYYSSDDVIKATNRYAVNTANINRFRICFFLFSKSNHMMKRATKKNWNFFHTKHIFFAILRSNFHWLSDFMVDIIESYKPSQAKSSYSIEYYFKMLTDNNIEEHK